MSNEELTKRLDNLQGMFEAHRHVCPHGYTSEPVASLTDDGKPIITKAPKNFPPAYTLRSRTDVAG